MTSPAGALHGADTADLRHRVDALLGALDIAGERVPAAVAAQVRATATQVRERLELGVDQTVVALAGGTGSGKSSLFNAVTGLDFAEVGVRRPTSSHVTACVWGADGGPLLDWLGVGRDDRIERESALDADEQVALRGLVLLDLPDHDSVSDAHREVVDRAIPVVDLLVWVVDPQKYADDALHTQYLQPLAGHEDSMLVVLNQVDTLAPDVRGELIGDLRRLLADDGLPGAAVLPVSARTGEGIDAVRAGLARVVGQRSSAARRAGTELDEAARLLAPELGEAEPAAAPADVAPMVDALTDAAGLPAVAAAAGAATRGGKMAMPELAALPAPAVELVRSSWLDRACGGLPRAWAQDVAARVAGADELRAALTAALAAVTPAVRRSRAALVLTVLAVVFGAAVFAGAGLAWWRWADRRAAEVFAAAGLACVILCLVALWLAAVARRAAGRRRAAAVTADGRAAVETVLRARLVEPAQQVHDERRRARDLLAVVPFEAPAA